MGLPTGPSPTPTATKILMGNPGKRPINENEPKPEKPKRCPSPPKWLAPEAKKEWRRVAPYLFRVGLLTEADLTALSVYCQNVAVFMDASVRLANEGPVVDNGKGQKVRNPAQASAASAANIIKAFCAEFGLTPSSRTRMQIPGEPERNDLDVILNGGA